MKKNVRAPPWQRLIAALLPQARAHLARDLPGLCAHHLGAQSWADLLPNFEALGMEATRRCFLSLKWVALGIMLCSGLFSAYRDNRRALRHGLLAATAGLGILLISLMGLRWQWLSAFPFMVLTGLGLYLPYVLVHTTLFERLMAVTRDGGNLGFLMYLADSAGYLGTSA